MERHTLKQFLVYLMAITATACAGKSGDTTTAITAASTGSERLSWTNEAVHFDTTGGVGTSLNTITASSIAVPITMTQVAVLSPPTVNAVVVQANAITFNLNRAYVAYNTAGTGYGGGIDVIDITTAAAPVVTGSVALPTLDFTGLARDGADLFVTGASTNGAQLYRYPLNLLGDLTTAPDVASLPGSVGLGVQLTLTKVYAVSGDNGGLSVFNRASVFDLLYTPTYAPLADARSVSVALTGDVRVVTGLTGSTAAHIERYDTNGTHVSTSGSLTNPTDDEAKSTIAAGVNLDLATAGEGGTRLVCVATNQVVQTIPIPTSATLAPSFLAANSATFGNGLIYVANGAGGIYVYSVQQLDILPSCNVSLQYVGRIVFADGTSVNNVAYNNGTLIVATGAGGFRIINVTQGIVVGLMGYL